MIPTLVIGVGTASRGDDALGLEVARRVRALRPSGALVLESAGDAAALMASWQGAERVILVDAATGAGPPGTVRRFEAQDGPLPALSLHVSTHSMGVAAAVELARHLGQLPPSVVVYAVEGRGFEQGSGLSADVAAALPEVVERVLTDLGAN